ncbi:hypothetical protein K5D51_20315 [Pseudomonas cichorii]|nr:hypothetical protein [Pseudomonas cichorii]MBX8561809.1 hypothetical protein [Pseudomonas cichorii]MBX8581920.1 hypothetical protein [Pseudomonas cichorii]
MKKVRKPLRTCAKICADDASAWLIRPGRGFEGDFSKSGAQAFAHQSWMPVAIKKLAAANNELSIGYQKTSLNSAMTTIRPIRKMMPTVPPRNLSIFSLHK